MGLVGCPHAVVEVYEELKKLVRVNRSMSLHAITYIIRKLLYTISLEFSSIIRMDCSDYGLVLLDLLPLLPPFFIAAVITSPGEPF